MSIIRPSLLLALSLLAAAVQAQGSYPNRAIRIIVAVTPGGASDLVARGIAKEMSDDLGQSVVIENRPSASSLVGTQLAAKAAPDGYTLLHMANTFAVVPSLLANPGYDLKDFVGISLTGIVPMILSVSPTVPVNSVEELVALARSKPGQLTYASAGLGGTGHMAAEMFSNQLGIKMIHVPYKGASQALTDLIGGQVMMMFDQMTSSMAHVRSGRIRPLAVTSLTRSPLLPNIPTVDEAGVKGFEDSTFTGLMAPAGTPVEILNRLNASVQKAVRQQVLRQRFLEVGVELVASPSPEDFNNYVRREFDKKAKVIRENKIKVE